MVYLPNKSIKLTKPFTKAYLNNEPAHEIWFLLSQRCMIRDDPGDHVRHAYSLPVPSLLKPPSHLGEDHEVRTTAKFYEHSGDVVKLVKYHTTLLRRHCQVLTASNTFLLGITRAPAPTSSYHVLATSKKIASRAMYHVHTASFHSDKCCSA